GAAAANQPAPGLERLAKRRGTDADDLRVGRSKRRHRAHSDRRSNEAGDPARAAVATGAKIMIEARPRRSQAITGRSRFFCLKRSVSSVFSVSTVAVLLSAGVVSAQKMTGSPAAAGYRTEPGQPAATLPAPLREIGFDQNLDQHVPLDTTFRDESGRTVRLGDYFGSRPVVLVFAYYDCPMLCTQVISGLASALGVLSLEPGR